MRQVMLGTRQRGQMPDVVEVFVHVEWIGDVEFFKAEPGVAREVFKIARRARDEVVQTHHFVAIRQQTVTQMGADESGGPRNQISQESLLKTS